MRQERISRRRRPTRARPGWLQDQDDVLPLDPRDPAVVRAKRVREKRLPA